MRNVCVTYVGKVENPSDVCIGKHQVLFMSPEVLLKALSHEAHCDVHPKRIELNAHWMRIDRVHMA